MDGLKILLDDLYYKLTQSFGRMTEVYSFVEFIEPNGAKVISKFEDFKQTTDTSAEKLINELKERILPKFENHDGLVLFHFVFYGECPHGESMRARDAIHIGCVVINNSIKRVWTIGND